MREETIQAVRRRQREKQQQLLLQVMRLEKESEVSRLENQPEQAREADTTLKRMNETTEALGQQIMIIERIMEESGLTLDLDAETGADRDMLEQSREEYEERVADADEAVKDQAEQTAYIDNISAPHVVPRELFDEDEAMRDLDECAKQTGRG